MTTKRSMSREAPNRLGEAQALAAYYQAQYEFLLSQIPNPTFLLDPSNDRIAEVNAAACRLLGYTEKDLTTRLRISDIHPDEMSFFLQFGDEVIRNGSA